MLIKRLLAATAAAAMAFTSLRMPSFFAAADDEQEEYLCRDLSDLTGDQHYIDTYNTVTSEHFQIIWGDDDQTGIINDEFLQVNLDALEQYRELFTTELCMKDSSQSIFEPDGQKYKTNVFLTQTGLPDFETGWAYTSYEPFSGFAYIFISPAAMVQLDGTNCGSLAHEYGHVLTYHQKAWSNQNITDPWWETVANWFKEQYFSTLETPTTHFFLPYLRNMNLTIPHGRNNYDSWIFLQYLTENPDGYDTFGKDFVMRMQSEALPDEYPFDTIQRLSGCDMKSVIGNFAKRMAALDFEHRDLYEQSLDIALTDPFVWQLIYTQPIPSPDNPGSYIVPAEKAPMQTGMNVIPLNTGSGSVTVSLKGISDAEGADWRACIVAVEDDGSVYYSPLFGQETMTLYLYGHEKALYLTVAATPDRIIPNNAYLKAEQGDEYSYTGADYKRRYPYEITIYGTTPMERSITEGVEGHPHSYGGGFVADTAYVEDTVYVEKGAMVLGNSQVTDNAVITGNAIVNNAIVSDNARITDGACVHGYWWAQPTVSGNAKVGERAVVTAGASVSGNARIMGNAYLLDNYSATDDATIKGTAYCYGDGVASGQAILDGEFYNNCNISQGTAFGWLETDAYNSSLPYTDGLFAGYEFSNSSNIFAYDTYGATNGIMRNAPLWEEERTSAGGVITFNGADQYIICDRTLVDYKDMEISTAVLWRGGETEQRIFEFGNNEILSLTPSNYKGKAELRVGGTIVTADTELPVGEWAVIRVIICGNVAKLMINGRLAGQSMIYTLPEDTISRTSHYYIARGGEGGFFNGSMDYFRVYFKESEEPAYYYTQNETIEEDILYGDANCDGIVDTKDFDLIVNAIIMPTSYGVNGTSDLRITFQGIRNADVYDRGNGITTNDALAIRRYLNGTTKSLPEC